MGNNRQIPARHKLCSGYEAIDSAAHKNLNLNHETRVRKLYKLIASRAMSIVAQTRNRISAHHQLFPASKATDSDMGRFPILYLKPRVR